MKDPSVPTPPWSHRNLNRVLDVRHHIRAGGIAVNREERHELDTDVPATLGHQAQFGVSVGLRGRSAKARQLAWLIATGSLEACVASMQVR